MISEQMERERSGRGRLNGMIFVSLVFHTALLSLLFFSPSFPSPKMTFGPVYTVALVNFSGRSAAPKGGAAGARELIEAGRSETVLKKSVKAEAAVPIHSLEGRRKQDPTLEKAMAEIRKRAAAAGPKPTPQTKAGSDAKAAPDQKAAAASPLPAGDSDADAKINAYYAALWSRIKKGWALPGGILPGEVLETVIDVTILRSGAITDVNFEKRSGNRFFDDSALKAIQKASPFPPLPVWIGGASLDVGIRFHSAEMGQ